MPLKTHLAIITSIRKVMYIVVLGAAAFGATWVVRVHAENESETAAMSNSRTFDERIRANAIKAVLHGRKTFRHDTFGDEAFWGGKLRLHQAIKGEQLGGVGPGISPKGALNLGLKVDI